MGRMRMESVDMTAQNIEKIGDLFPNCIIEMLYKLLYQVFDSAHKCPKINNFSAQNNSSIRTSPPKIKEYPWGTLRKEGVSQGMSFVI